MENIIFSFVIYILVTHVVTWKTIARKKKKQKIIYIEHAHFCNFKYPFKHPFLSTILMFINELKIVKKKSHLTFGF